MTSRPARRAPWRVAIQFAVAALATGVLAATPPASRAAIGTPDTSTAAVRGPCVAPVSIMRRDHMELLKHDRQATVRDGIRRPDRTLEGCVACHAVAGEDGRPVSIDDSRHFCNVCHLSAAVSIDCFTCHRSTPSAVGAIGAGP
jgi:hypothetical protein